MKKGPPKEIQRDYTVSRSTEDARKPNDLGKANVDPTPSCGDADQDGEELTHTFGLPDPPLCSLPSK
jgi:hypothetical protein